MAEAKIDDSLNATESPKGGCGTLSFQHRVSDVLAEIAAESMSGEILCHLRSNTGAIDGYLLISDSDFIVGAICDDDKTQGYEAMSKLLTLTLGQYSWSEIPIDSLPKIEKNLQIRLKTIIPKLPFLPETLSQFFDESSLLDKIFVPREWANEGNLLNMFFYPEPMNGKGADPDPKPQSSIMTLTALEPVTAMKAKHGGVRVPTRLRERLFKCASLAHTIERNFTTMPGAYKKRIDRKSWSFEFSRFSKPRFPLFIAVAIITCVCLGYYAWMSFDQIRYDDDTKSMKPGTVLHHSNGHRTFRRARP